MTDERRHAIRMGKGRHNDAEISAALVRIAADADRLTGDNDAAILSEAAARLHIDGWRKEARLVLGG